MRRREIFPVKLSKAEKKALQILANYGDVSMGEFTREQIRAAWYARFEGAPLGEVPNRKKEKKDALSSL